MAIRIAQERDLDALCDFYQEIAEQLANTKNAPKWEWEVYPNRDLLENALHTAQVVIDDEEGQIAAAGILSVGEDPAYQKVDWKHKFPDQQIAVLHLFTVSADFRGRGLAGKMLSYIFDLARSNGQKVVHIDMLIPNASAQRAYEKAGFKLNSVETLYYDDIGYHDTDMFEYLL